MQDAESKLRLTVCGLRELYGSHVGRLRLPDGEQLRDARGHEDVQVGAVEGLREVGRGGRYADAVMDLHARPRSTREGMKASEAHAQSTVSNLETIGSETDPDRR